MVIIDGKCKIELNDYLFWDVDKERIDLQKSKHLIFDRVLKYGNVEEFKEILRYYGFYELRELSKLIGNPSPKIWNFLSRFFDIPKEEFRCYKRKMENPFSFSI